MAISVYDRAVTLTAFLLALGAVARVTRFVNADILAQPIRNLAMRRHGPGGHAAILIHCPWCLSIWIAAPLAPLAYWYGDRAWFVIPAAWLSLSYVYAIVAQWADSDDD